MAAERLVVLSIVIQNGGFASGPVRQPLNQHRLFKSHRVNMAGRPDFPPRRTLPGQAACRKPYKPRTDKCFAQSHPEATPMSSTSQTPQERRPANLAALQQKLQEMAASTKSPAPTTRPVIAHGPVIVVRGK